MNSITRRWVKNSLFITLFLLVSVEIIFIVFTYSSYYNSARQAILSRVNTVNGQLRTGGSAPDAERALTLRRMVEEFNEKDKFELMLLDIRGNVISTSSGFNPGQSQSNEDFVAALTSSDGIGEYVGVSAGGEKIMSVCFIVPYPAGNVLALRFVTSLTKVNEKIVVFGVTSAVIVLIIVLFSVLSGMYFVRSIVQPIGNIEATATRIAAGDFDARLENPYNDEVGRLCNTINHMAEELGKTEQMKKEFISSVSHELRTPMTRIKGW
ncbi:MAG: HAMP domain-containing protein, partial [Oscillospiraceae bacterium]|nr:HAMP domain-containing protein [Oscillospiraceae bacterium]